MRSQFIVAVLFTSVVAAGGCGGSDSPSAPSPTVQSITVTSSSDLLHVGATETFTASATLSDGSTHAVTGGVWGGDAPFVASVEAGTGRVTGVGSGMVTIFVDAEGRRGTKLVRGLPNYQGTWSGSYYVTGCSQTGAFALADICRDTFSVNRVLPISMINTQSRDAVNGQFALGTIAGSGTGPIQTNGELTFAGTARSGDLSLDTAWSMQSAQAGRITGSGSFIVRFAGLSGEARVNVTVRDLNRTSNLQVDTATPGRPVRSLADLAAALEGR
jgi:hypothetical protein